MRNSDNTHNAEHNTSRMESDTPKSVGVLDEAEREKRRKAAIASSGRAANILAGDTNNSGAIKKVLGA